MEHAGHLVLHVYASAPQFTCIQNIIISLLWIDSFYKVCITKVGWNI